MRVKNSWIGFGCRLLVATFFAAWLAPAALGGGFFEWQAYSVDTGRGDGNFNNAGYWWDEFADPPNQVPGSDDAAIFNSDYVHPFNSNLHATISFPGSSFQILPDVYTTSSLSVVGTYGGTTGGSSDVTFVRTGGPFLRYDVVTSIEISGGSKLTTTFGVTCATAKVANGGELDVTGGSLTIGLSDPSQPALLVSDNTGNGLVRTLGGSRIELTGASGIATLGQDSGSAGEVDVDGAGSTLVLDGMTSTLKVGDNGTGIMKITNGGLVDDNAAVMGVQSGPTALVGGSVTVDGATSLWNNRDHLVIGTNTGFFIPTSVLTLAGGGTTTVTNQMLLGSKGEIAGSGTVNAGSIVSNGIFKAGADAGNVHQAGTLHISTPTALISSGQMLITLAGTNPGVTYDQILFNGSTMLNGSLSVSLANSFIPLLGNHFHILDLGTTSGTFTSVALPSLLPGLAWDTSQLYTMGVIGVVSAGVSGDYNGNGIVDAADYTVWRDHLGQNFALQNRDPGASGPIGAADYDYWVSHFGNHAGSGAIGAAGVPESASLVLLISGTVMICSRRWSAIQSPRKTYATFLLSNPSFATFFASMQAVNAQQPSPRI
jgi:T5SS/PEP-CTERM-associated repeat protein